MSSGFVTESEAAEARKLRQEEWEKVRAANEPLECPEKPYDGRSLYEKLREQKLKKDLEYEETHKLKNLVRGLDDDEVQFLDLVEQRKMNAEKEQMKEEEQELKEFRTRVASLQEEIEDKKLNSELRKSKPKRNSMNNIKQSQKSLMESGIKRKYDKIDANATSSSCVLKMQEAENKSIKPHQLNQNEEIRSIVTKHLDRGSLNCIGILPGIGPYNDSSDSEMSSGSEDEPDTCGGYDLIGIKRVKKKIACDEE